jgi:exodeoxyribonuclease III
MCSTAAKAVQTCPDLLTIVSLNVGSLKLGWRAGLRAYIDANSPDIICLQDLKLSRSDVPNFILPDYHGYFTSPGFRTAVYTKIVPLNVTRAFWADLGTILEFEQVFLVTLLAPNPSARLQDWLSQCAHFVKELHPTKPMVITGDFNIAYTKLDVFSAEEPVETPGFSVEERDWFTQFLESGFVDVFRENHPEPQQFT